MLDSLETAYGTTAGRKHRTGLLESNQDTVLVHRSKNLLTLTVGDGCSSAKRSHVASELQTSWFTRLVHNHGDKLDQEDIWTSIAHTLGDQIRTVSRWQHYDSPADAVADMWSATVFSIVVTPTITYFLGFGDGRFIINGELVKIEPANIESNTPAYPGYLVGGFDFPEDELAFTVFAVRTDQIEHAAVATDGLDYLIQATGKLIPGTTNRVPPISYLWECDELYDDGPRGIDQLLNYIGRDWRKPGGLVSGGKLHDDLAIAAFRRKA